MKTQEEILKDLAEAFLSWPLPESVCADRCTTEQGKGRIGTNLLSYFEALAMMRDIVAPVLTSAQAEASRWQSEEAQRTRERDEARVEGERMTKLEAFSTAVKSDWVNCPICGESDMHKEEDAEGNAIICCTNHCCASNGGDNTRGLLVPLNDAWRTAEHATKMRDHSESLLADALVRLTAATLALTEERAKRGEDSARLDCLEKLIRNCPHAKFDFSDDPDNDAPMGFSISVDGCDPTLVAAPTFREVIDLERAARKSP